MGACNGKEYSSKAHKAGNGKKTGAGIKASRADMKKAHILYVTLKCNWKGNPDIKTVEDMKYGLGAGGMTAMYAPPNGPKGLRSKYFTYCKKTDSIYGVYTWFDRESLDNYVKSDLFAAHLTWPQFSSVSYQIFDVMEGTELAIDQGSWSGENGTPCAADFNNKAYMLHVFLSIDYKGNPDVPNEEAFRWGVRADGGKFPSYYVGMDGLRSKYFTMLQDDNGKGRPATDLCVGFYTFFTKEALNKYLESDLFKMHNTFPQFSKIDYAVHEVLPGTERTMDLGSWTGAVKPVPVKASLADMKKAHILYVTLKCNWKGNPDIKTVDDMKYGLGEGGMTAMYAPPNGPKGLRHKYFTYCKETDSIYGVYTWFDRESLDNYVKSDLFAAHLTWPQFSSVSYQIFDVMEGTELAIDQGSWSGKNGAPCAADFNNKAYMLHVFLSVDYKGNPDVPNEEAFRWGVRADGGKFPAYYVGMDGLRSKFFTMLQDDNGKGRPATDLCVGFYTFFTKEALDKYLESDLFKMHNTFPQFAKIDYTVHEVMPGTERTMDLGSWTGAGKKVPSTGSKSSPRKSYKRQRDTPRSTSPSATRK